MEACGTPSDLRKERGGGMRADTIHPAMRKAGKVALSSLLIANAGIRKWSNS
jgi:hypothetical protein